MSWADVVKIIAAFIVSIGGIGTTIVWLSKFLAERIAERLKASYQLDLDKKLEEHKAVIEQAKHIRQSNFDREIMVYQDLCDKFNSLIDAVFYLFPTGITMRRQFESDDDLLKDCNDRLHEANEKYRSANVALATKAAFIPKEYYVKFDNIRADARMQIYEYYSLNPWAMKTETDRDIIKERRSCSDRSREILEKWDSLIDELREYIKSLSEQKENNHG